MNFNISGKDNIAESTNTLSVGNSRDTLVFGVVSDYTTGLPNIRDAVFLQNLGSATDKVMGISSGQLLVDNSMMLYSDALAITNPTAYGL